MLKAKRQNKILELISQNNIETQNELADALLNAGFNVTQATVSRDIKELKLVKVLLADGVYAYTRHEKQETQDEKVLLRIFADTVLSVKAAANLIIVKTLPGSASAAAEIIDTLHFGSILGSIAGDNTIFIAAETETDANNIAVTFLKYLEN